MDNRNLELSCSRHLPWIINEQCKIHSDELGEWILQGGNLTLKLLQFHEVGVENADIANRDPHSE